MLIIREKPTSPLVVTCYHKILSTVIEWFVKFESMLTFVFWIRMTLIIIIGPRSDHSFRLSVINKLTHDLLEFDVTTLLKIE